MTVLWSPKSFGWLRQLLAAPLIGPAPLLLNTSRPVLQVMLRTARVDLKSCAADRRREYLEQQSIRPSTRCALRGVLVVVSGGLGCRNTWQVVRQQATLLEVALFIVRAEWSGFSGQAHIS